MECMFESFLRAQSTTRTISRIQHIENHTELKSRDKNKILRLLEGKSVHY